MKQRKDSKGRNLKPGESERADGRYMYRYTSLSGKRETIYRDDLATLRIKEKSIQKDLSDKIDTNAATRTLNTQFQSYMSTKTQLRLSTKNNYVNMWEKHIQGSTLGNMQIGQIKKSDILKFYASLSHKGLKNGTIHLCHNIISPCFNLAVDDDVIRKNPSIGCMKEFSVKDENQRQALTIDEQAILLEYVKSNKTYSRYFPMIVFMIGTATRCGETIGLTWKDIKISAKEVSINHQLIYKKVGGVIKFYVSKPKSSTGVRNIPLTDDVVEQLKILKKQNKVICIQEECVIDGYKNFVFTTKGGKPIQPNCVNRFLINIVKTYNKEENIRAIEEKRKPILLPHISAHILRHTGCTRMAEHGMDTKVLQIIMGHSDISVTNKVYNHVDEARKKTQMKKMEGKLHVS